MLVEGQDEGEMQPAAASVRGRAGEMDTALFALSLSLRWSPVGSFATTMLVVCYSSCMVSSGLTFETLRARFGGQGCVAPTALLAAVKLDCEIRCVHWTGETRNRTKKAAAGRQGKSGPRNRSARKVCAKLAPSSPPRPIFGAADGKAARSSRPRQILLTRHE